MIATVLTPTAEQTVTISYQQLALYLSIGAAILTQAVAWGSLRQQVKDLKEIVNKLVERIFDNGGSDH